MCGIFGVLLRSPTDLPDEPALRESARLLEHRGPDGFGVYASEGIGLAHTRLSLVDLNARSDQPFWDRSGRHALVYNGEIYNFRELKGRLQAQGVEFRTSSDTELLLEALVRWGLEPTLGVLEGMFAFALYDSEDRSLVVARDRLGIKPLYVYEDGDRFLFSSEILALRPWIPFIPDLPAITSYFLGSPSKGCAFIKGVRVLTPGTRITIRQGQASEHARFTSVADLWDPEQAEQLRGQPEHRLIDIVDEALNDSVKTQLFADAPVGVFCSGGVDSSLITAIAVRQHDSLGVFHAHVIGKSSEFEQADQLARHLGLELQSVEVVPQDFIDCIPDVVRHYEYPFTGLPSSIPFLKVSRLVREQGVKGVLSGEGADECFLGYRFIVPSLGDLLSGLPRRLQTRFTSSWRRITGHRRYIASDPSFRRGVRRGLINRFDREIELDEIQRLVETSLEGDVDPRNLMTLRLLALHLCKLLHRNDALGMAGSIEARFPFLSSEVTRLATNLPFRTKIRAVPSVFDRHHPFVTDKWIVRKVADRYLPKQLSRRPKAGFPVEAHKRIRFAPRFFQNTFITQLFELSSRATEFMVENAQHELLLSLAYINVWAEIFLNGDSLDTVRDRLRANASIKTGGKSAASSSAERSGKWSS